MPSLPGKFQLAPVILTQLSIIIPSFTLKMSPFYITNIWHITYNLAQTIESYGRRGIIANFNMAKNKHIRIARSHSEVKLLLFADNKIVYEKS